MRQLLAVWRHGKKSQARHWVMARIHRDEDQRVGLSRRRDGRIHQIQGDAMLPVLAKEIACPVPYCSADRVGIQCREERFGSPSLDRSHASVNLETSKRGYPQPPDVPQSFQEIHDAGMPPEMPDDYIAIEKIHLRFGHRVQDGRSDCPRHLESSASRPRSQHSF